MCGSADVMSELGLGLGIMLRPGLGLGYSLGHPHIP